MAAPVIIAQKYMETASGELTPLTYVEDIAKLPETKYYTIANFYIDTAQNKGTAYSADVSGKYGSRLNLHVFVSCPLYYLDTGLSNTGRVPFNVPPSYVGNQSGPLFVLDDNVVDKKTLSSLDQDSVAS